MSQRSRLPPQRSDVDERPSTDAEQPSKPDLMCPTCGTFLVNVGNLNRHRRVLHRWVNPDNRKTRKVQPTHLVLSEGNASGHPLNASELTGWITDSDLPFLPPFPPPEDVVDIPQYSSDGQVPSYHHADIPTGYVDDATADSASYVQIEAPTPIRLPALTNSTLLSASSDPSTTPSPPYVAHTLGHTLGGNIASREDHLFATSFSSPVDDSNQSSDAMDAGGITDHGDFSIFAFGTTHSSVPSHRSTEFEVVKGRLYQLPRARAPRHLNPLSIAGPEYHSHFSPSTHALSVQTMHFPPVPPSQPGLFRSDTMESSHCDRNFLSRNMEWREDRTTSGMPVRFKPDSSSKKVIRVSGPCIILTRRPSNMQGPPRRLTSQLEWTSTSARLKRAPRTLQQAYYTPLFSAQSGDHLAGLSEQAPYERSAHSVFDSQLLPAFYSHRCPGEHLQARYASFDEIAHYLNDPAIHAPNVFGNFNPCCPESDMSAF